MFFWIVVISTSKTGKMIWGKDLILRIYFVIFIVAVLEVKLYRFFVSVWFFPYIYACIYNSAYYAEEYMIYCILILIEIVVYSNSYLPCIQ